MKKFLLTALIAVSLVSSSFATTGNKVSALIKNSFESDFKNIKNVEWTSNASHVTATFNLNGKTTQAFYEYNGNFIGTTKAITIEDLPTSAKRVFAKKYNNYTVKEAIKFDQPEETSYFISAQKENESIVLKVVDGQVSIFKRN